MSTYINNYNTNGVIGEVEIEEKVNKKIGVHYQLPNVSRAYGTEYYLTDVEMAVLVQIGTNVTAFDTDIVKTNVDMLNAELEIDKNLSRGRSIISESIISLQQKGYIKVDFVGKNIKDSPLLTIHILHDLNDVSVTKDGTTFTGYTAVDKKLLGLAKQGKPVKFGRRLKILTHIAWRSKLKLPSGKKYSISFEEWKNILGVVMSTAKSNIKKLEEDGIIEILHGEYKRNEDGTLYLAEDGRPKQERNTYFLQGEKPEVVEGYRPNAVKKHKREVAIESIVKKIMSEGEPRIAERPNLVMYGSKLSVDDIEIFLTTESETLVEESRNKFAVLIGGEDKKKRDIARQMLLDWETEVRALFEGGNEHKIKRSIFNLDGTNLSDNERTMTPDELKEKVDTFGYDNEDEDVVDYDINSQDELDLIVESAKENIEEEDTPLYLTEEFRSRVSELDDELMEEIDSLPFM